MTRASAPRYSSSARTPHPPEPRLDNRLRIVDSTKLALKKNLDRLMVEIRETGELSVLLAKAVAGQKLTAVEKGKMRAQLLDLAKAIPALAIFAAPGGLILLVALAKVLPFSLLPSAFQEEPKPEGESPAPPAVDEKA